MADRIALLVVHTGRRAALSAGRDLITHLAGSGMQARVLESESDALACADAQPVPTDAQAADGAELVVALGGDGTLLRAAEHARPSGAALLGVNLGHVGFLAEADRSDLDRTVERVLSCEYDVEERLTLDIRVRLDGQVTARDWALN